MDSLYESSVISVMLREYYHYYFKCRIGEFLAVVSGNFKLTLLRGMSLSTIEFRSAAVL